jgi:hypothetical protein
MTSFLLRIRNLVFGFKKLVSLQSISKIQNIEEASLLGILWNLL